MPDDKKDLEVAADAGNKIARLVSEASLGVARERVGSIAHELTDHVQTFAWGYAEGWADGVNHVSEKEKSFDLLLMSKIRECGFPGCSGFATTIVVLERKDGGIVVSQYCDNHTNYIKNQVERDGKAVLDKRRR